MTDGHYLVGIGSLTGHRFFLVTNLLCILAAGMKPTTGGWVGWVWYIAAETDALSLTLLFRVGYWNGGNQGFGVRVLRFSVQILGWTQLDNLAQVHHCHPVADVFDHA